MADEFAAGTTDFAAGFGVGGTLAEGVEVVDDAEVEDVASDGVAEDGGVEDDDGVAVFGVFLGWVEGRSEGEVDGFDDSLCCQL